MLALHWFALRCTVVLCFVWVALLALLRFALLCLVCIAYTAVLCFARNNSFERIVTMAFTNEIFTMDFTNEIFIIYFTKEIFTMAFTNPGRSHTGSNLGRVSAELVTGAVANGSGAKYTLCPKIPSGRFKF